MLAGCSRVKRGLVGLAHRTTAMAPLAPGVRVIRATCWPPCLNWLSLMPFPGRGGPMSTSAIALQVRDSNVGCSGRRAGGGGGGGSRRHGRPRARRLGTE